MTRSFPRFTYAGLATTSLCLAACHPTPPTPRAVTLVQAPPAASAQPPPDAEGFRSKVPSAGQDVAWNYPSPSVSSLSNGVALYVLPRATGPVALSLTLRHGASDVPASASGLSLLIAHLMAEATKAKNHHALSEAAESLGSTIVGDANRDFITLTLDTLPEDFRRGVELLAETLTAPAFNRDDFLRLQKQQLDELANERQAPARLASLVGLRATLGERLGAPVSGNAKTVSKLTLEDVRAWYKQFVHPEAVALCIVGPVEPSQAREIAEKSLGRLQGKRPAQDAPAQPPPPNATQFYVLDRPGSVQSAIFVAQPFPKRATLGYAARQLLDNVLGGQFTSRINQNLREKHAYTYGAHSTVIATRYFGLLTLATSVRTEATIPAVQELFGELRAIRGPTPLHPIDDAEMQRARAGLVQRLGAHLEDGHRLLSDYEQLFVHELAPNYLEEYLTEARSLPASALVTEAERIDPDRLVVVIVGDGDALRSQLQSVKWSALPVPPDWID